MARRRRGSCSKENTKVMFEGEVAFVDRHHRDQHSLADRINLLPDELLVSILSLLTLKESVATSILSRRWRYLWTLMPKLYFDARNSLKLEMDYNEQWITDEAWSDEERSIKYVIWVNRVIALHKSCVIEDFRLYLYLDGCYKKYMDNWVKYALTRKVKRLELDLTCTDVLLPYPSTYYRFPYKTLIQPEEICSNRPILNSSPHSMRQCNTIHFKYLEKLSLKCVNVNGEALEFFLSNCPLLQHLSVSESFRLSTLKIIGPFPSLKHLEIISCVNLNSLEICDANLVYLKYVGQRIQQCLLKNVPQLVEMYIEGDIDMIDCFSMFSSILPQLEKLNYASYACWEVPEVFYSAVKKSNLKQLVLRPPYHCSLPQITNILRASPCLETFELKAWSGLCTQKRELLTKEAGPYAHLKEVKIQDYCGSTAVLEFFVMHLSKSAAALEKVVIEPQNHALTLAKTQLVRKLPPRINLQIL